MKKTDACYTPVKTAGTADCRFFDFGKHYFAVLEIEADAAEKQEITLAVGEVLAADGRIERQPGGSRIYQEEKVTLRPGKNRIAMNMFHPGYNAGTLPIEPNAVPFRYAEVRGCSGPVKAVQHAYYFEFDDGAADLPAVRTIWTGSGNSASTR